MNQRELMRKYGKEHRTQFNPYLFKRDTDDIIEQVKNVILSCQRNSSFIIRVESFEVIEDYMEIMSTLKAYEDRNKNKNKKKENPYDYINLKDSEIVLLVVNYYIEIKEQHEYVTVYIAIPRIIDKYYFKIYGNIYSAMYQIVDASTYNNSTSNAKSQSVTQKTMFMPIRIYKTAYTLKTTEKDQKKCVFYLSRIFNKNLGAMKYLLGKFGLYGTFQLLGFDCIYFTKEDPQNPDWYTFGKKDDLYISSPKVLFDTEPMIQSLLVTIFKSVNKDTTVEDLFTHEFWLKSLGGEFNNFSVEKGSTILESFESIYDKFTSDSIRLPEEYKCDTYRVVRWMMREFIPLKKKSNLDISTKKIRYAEYIASLYAMKISRGIYRIADLNKRADLNNIKRAIITQPMALLKSITKCKLVNYKNMVNDNDALVALKFTYKGVSGLGENSNQSIPDIYRAIDISHIGRVDMDSSSAGDPGVTGTICPMVDLYDGSFSDFEEPNYWEDDFSKTMTEYKKAQGIQDLITFEKQVFGKDNEDELIISDAMDMAANLLRPVALMEQSSNKVSLIPLILEVW